MAAKNTGGKSADRKAAPLYGPTARRAREKFLDTQAAGSRLAKHGVPDAEAAPIPAPLLPPSRVDHLFALAKALRKAGAPARAAAKAQARAERDATRAAEVVELARAAEAHRLAEVDRMETARLAAAREVARVEAARTAAEAEERRRESVARERARIERARLADEAKAAVDARAREVARIEAERAARSAARKASDALAERPGPMAALYRGRVNSETASGALLLMAPAPGGHAGRCFAELLRRQAEGFTGTVRFTHSPEAGDDEGAEPARRAREDLLALADLYREADGFYRTLDVAPGEGPPVNGNLLRASSVPLGGSISSQLVEG